MKKKLFVGILVLTMLVACLSITASADTFDGAEALAEELGDANTDVEGNVVKLTNAVTVSNKNLIVKGDVVLDLNGQTLTFESGKLLGCGPIDDDTVGGSKLTIRDSSDDQAGKILSESGVVLHAQAGGTVVLEGGTVESTFTNSDKTADPAVVALTKSTFKMTGGTIKGAEAALQVQDADTVVEISNGKIESTSDSAPAIAVTDESTFTMEGGEISAAGEAISVGTTKETDAEVGKVATATLKGTVKVTCGTKERVPGMQVKDYGVLNIEDDATIKGSLCVFENGRLNVTGGTITADGFAISTNGSPAGSENNSVGAIITISGGEITGEGENACGVYLPAGELTVSGTAEISGKAGIVVRGGDLSVEGGTIEATGGKDATVTVGDAGNSVPAAGIVVDNAGYPGQKDGQKHVTVKDGATVKAPADGKTLAVTNKGSEVAPGEGGKLDTEKNPFDIVGGTFEVNGEADTDVSKFLREGYSYSEEANKIVEDPDAEFEAQIGDQKYSTLAEAVKAATGGDTITLLKDVTLPGTGEDGEGRIEVTKKIILDLGGYELSKSSEITAENVAGLKVGTNGDLTITGDGTFSGTGTLVATFAESAEGAKLTIEDSVLIHQETGEDEKNDAAVATNGGTITITGGRITAAESGVAIAGKSNLTVSGGKIDAKLFGIGTNGSETDATAEITVSGGTITGGDDACGVYLPAGKMTVSDEASISGGAGIVVRGGKLTVSGGSITATGSGTVTVGDAEKDGDKYPVPAAGITLDKATSYDQSTKVDFPAESTAVVTGNPAVAYTEDGESGKDGSSAITINDGTFKGDNAAADVKDFLVEGKILSADGEVIDGEGTLTFGLPEMTDSSTGPITDPVSNPDIVSTYDADTNTYNVQIIADEVKYHTHGEEGGYWVGFYIEAPDTRATHVKSSAVEERVALEDGDVDGNKRYTVYFDLSDGTPDPFTLTFYTSESGNVIVGRDKYTINVDLSGAKMDDMTLESAGFTYNADNDQLTTDKGTENPITDCGKETMYVKLSKAIGDGKYAVAVFKDGVYQYTQAIFGENANTSTFLYWSYLSDQVPNEELKAQGIPAGNYTFKLFTYTGAKVEDESAIEYADGTLTLDDHQFAELTSEAEGVDVTDEITGVEVTEAKGNSVEESKAVVTAEAEVNGHTINISGSASNLGTEEAIEVTLDLSNGTDETAGTVTVKIEKDGEDWSKVKVSSVTGAIAGTEDNQFKLLTKGEDFTVVADFAVVEVEVATGKTPTPEVPADLTDKIDEGAAKTIAEATKPDDDDTTLNELATEAVAEGPALNTDKGDAKTLLDDVVSSGDVQEDSIHFFVQPHLTLGITGYDDGADDGNKTFSVDISAVYDLVATTADSADQIDLTGEGTKNAVIIGESQHLEVSESIDLKVGLPTGFTQETEIYVKHVKNGNTHYHKATVEGDVATFTSDDGLSPFTFEAETTVVASIGNSYYTSLQDAVDAVKDGGTITLVGAISAEETEVIVGREVSFKIDKGSNEFDESLIKAGSGYTMGDPTVSGNVYEFTVTRSYTGGGASATTSKVTTPENGSVELSSTTARGGQTVTVTATPDEGYDVGDVIVKDRNGNPVEVTRNDDGTYSYTVPAGKTPVTVEVVFDECLCDDFADLDLDEWYHEAVDYAIKNELMLGQGDGWHPTDAVRGAEIFVILGRLDGAGLETGGDKWYDESLAWAMEKGYTDGSEPLANCSRERAVTLLWRYYGEQASDADITGFIDAADVSDWALDAMKWAVENEIIKGLDNNDIQPKKDLTRAEFATILERLGATVADTAE